MAVPRTWLICAFLVGIFARFASPAGDSNEARISVLIFDRDRDVNAEHKSIHLTGQFSAAGAKITAEGDVLQFHPAALCNTYEDSEAEYGTVAVIHLDSSYIEPHPCLSVYEKAKRAMQLGARAVIFIVNDSPLAVSQLEAETSPPLDHPILTLSGQDAHKLMQVVNQVKNAWAHIEPLQVSQETGKQGSNEFFDMGIFVAFFILISIICLLLVLKLRWRQKRKQTSQARQALNALSQMEVRKYCRSERHSQKMMSSDERWATTLSIASDGTICAICLEEFREGEELRIVPCTHEFHKHCVDPWLLSNRTCPLCMYNILDCGLSSKNSEASPTRLRSPVDQLRVSLPNSPTRDATWEGVYSLPPPGHHHRVSSSHHHHHHNHNHHHKHSKSRCGPGSSSKRDRSGPFSGGSSGAPRLPTSSQSQLERWFGRGPLTWQTNCEYVCSHCHRHINCGGQYGGSRCMTPRQLGLASFESHYVVNSAYSPWNTGIGSGVGCLRGTSGKRGGNHGAKQSHSRDQSHVPVQVHLESVATALCQQGAGSYLRDSESVSSLSLSAFNADYECSDSTSSPENFDSTQSVYGSSTTCRSEVTGCDPCMYSRPGGVVQQYWNVKKPTQLTPSCLHKVKSINAHRKHKSTSDSDDTKQSSDANTSASSNFSTHVNIARKDNIHPYKPPNTTNVTTPVTVSSPVRTSQTSHNNQVRTSQSSQTSQTKTSQGSQTSQVKNSQSSQVRTSQTGTSRNTTPSDSKPDTPSSSTITPQTDNQNAFQKSDSGQSQLQTPTPCACCDNTQVWESKPPSPKRSPPASPSRKMPSPAEREPSSERSGERNSAAAMGKGGRRSSKGTPTRKSRSHLSLPVQSVATLTNTTGTVITMPVQGATPTTTTRKVMEEIV